jgi:L-rhamnose isomerase
MEHKESRLVEAYGIAREHYGELGVDVDAVLKAFRTRSISLQCWQGDDGIGFEASDRVLQSGGILATGNHPGRVRNAEELRDDLAFALGLIPGCHRVNLHATYAETGSRRIARNELGPDALSIRMISFSK